jgi:hypothetical protein
MIAIKMGRKGNKVYRLMMGASWRHEAETQIILFIKRYPGFLV